MDSLISGIIDCVAKPSTSDSPVRVMRKSASESPKCVSSTDPDVAPSNESAHSTAQDSDSESSAIPSPPSHVRGISSVSSFSRLLVPGELTSPIKSVLTAEGIILGDEPLVSCGDCSAGCYDAPGVDDDATAISTESIDNAVSRQFEAAFATFLYKNPAFQNMSYTTLQKLRSKLMKESARNVKVEAELRRQLADLREAKRNRELELQKELLVVTRAKAAREAELRIRIEKTRRASMILEERLMDVGGASSEAATDAAAPPSPTEISASWQELGSPLSLPASPPSIVGSESFEEFQEEIRKNKMEQAHILAEMEKIKMQIAEETVNGAPEATL